MILRVGPEEESYYHKHEDDICWWKDSRKMYGPIVSFDQVHDLYLFRDYPHEFTPEQKEIFDRENPFWKDFFSGRCEK